MFHNISEEHGDIFIEEHPAGHENMQPSVQASPKCGTPQGTDIRAALIDDFISRDSDKVVNYCCSMIDLSYLMACIDVS